MDDFKAAVEELKRDWKVATWEVEAGPYLAEIRQWGSDGQCDVTIRKLFPSKSRLVFSDSVMSYQDAAALAEKELTELLAG